jgi:hypothetical protein
MTRVIFTASFLALVSVAAINYAGAQQTAISCNKEHETCNSKCNDKYDDLGERLHCRAICTDSIIDCLRFAAVNHELEAKEYIKKAIEERKKITCEPAKGNEQRCVQHGQDLMPAVHFKGGEAITNKEYASCKDDCFKKNSLDERHLCLAGCEGGAVGCLRGAAVNAEMVAKELKQKAIEESKKYKK